MVRKRIALLIMTCLLGACVRPAPTEQQEPPVEMELVIGLNAAELRPVVDDVIRSFEAKYPGVTVRVKQWDGPFYDFTKPVTEEMIQAQFDGMDLVISMYFLTGRPLNEHGYLRDLSSLSLPEFDPLVADYMQTTGVIDGQRVYVPIVRTPHMFAFNEVVFQEPGPTIPNVDWTYLDLERVLLELKEEGLLSRARVDLRKLFSSIVSAYGGQYYNFTAERWEVDTPENRAALGLLAQLAADELLPNPPSLYVYVEHPESAVLYIESRKLNRYRYLPYPAGPVSRVTGSVDATDAMILDTSKHPELAGAFMAEMLGPEVGAMAMARAGMRPLAHAPEAVELWREQVGIDWAVPFEMGLGNMTLVTGAEPRPSFDFWTELLAAVESGASMAEVLADLERRLNAGQ